MELMLFVFAASAVIELVSLLLPTTVRKYGVSLSTIATSFASGGIITAHLNVASALILIISIYRVVNLLRVVDLRMNESYLKNVSRSTSVWLLLFQVVVFVAWYAALHHTVADKSLFLALSVLQLATALILVLSLARSLHKTRFRKIAAAYADRDLPTVSVCIPARNEDEQLEECLQSLLASDYPKLEVIVLDDCSQDKTPEVIRGFAHDGVRFIPGTEPSEKWLAKNQAYDRLAHEASGEMLLFCGVDIRFSAHTVRELVTILLKKNKKMLSMMPLNEQLSPSTSQVLRYLWELALPRRLFNRPPVLSSCWLVMSDELKRLGGFAGVSRSIVPEAFFARELTKQDGYTFARADQHMGLTSVKTSKEQQSTAVRTRYPQLHRRMELVCLLTISEVSLLLAPFVMGVVGIWGVFGWATEICAVAAALLLMVLYRAVQFEAFPRNRWIVLPVFPFAVLYDVALMQYSMWKYEFSTVEWKGRNVCIPAMHVIDHLPKLQ
jgi:hypothetical protein